MMRNTYEFRERVTRDPNATYRTIEIPMEHSDLVVTVWVFDSPDSTSADVWARRTGDPDDHRMPLDKVIKLGRNMPDELSTVAVVVENRPEGETS